VPWVEQCSKGKEEQGDGERGMEIESSRCFMETLAWETTGGSR